MPRPEDYPDRGATKRDHCINCDKRKLVEHRRHGNEYESRIWSKCSNCGANQQSAERTDGPSWIHSKVHGQEKKRERATIEG